MKTIGQALQDGLMYARRYVRVLFPFYLATLLLAGLAALPWRSLLQAQAGHSLILKDIIAGFNYTFLNDLLQNYGAGLSPILNLSLGVIGLYLLVMVFLTAGLIKLLVKQPAAYDSSVFWGGGGQHFWPLLRLTLIFLLVHALILGLFGWLYLTVIKGGAPSRLDNEGIITASLNWLVPLYIVVAAFFFMWQDYAKVLLVKNPNFWVWSAMGAAFRFLRQNFRRCYGTYLLNMLLVSALFIINYCITKAFPISNSLTICLSFLFTQFFLLARYGLKVINLASVVSLVR